MELAEEMYREYQEQLDYLGPPDDAESTPTTLAVTTPMETQVMTNHEQACLKQIEMRRHLRLERSEQANTTTTTDTTPPLLRISDRSKVSRPIKRGTLIVPDRSKQQQQIANRRRKTEITKAAMDATTTLRPTSP